MAKISVYVIGELMLEEGEITSFAIMIHIAATRLSNSN